MEIIFQSRCMQGVLAVARKYAGSSASVLICGESGTGKELVARYIHDHSPRAQREYRVVNCAAFSTTLAESELFGHEQGAFTSAERQHRGHMAMTEDGTLFLDEVGELPLSIQAKLLRVVESGEYYRVGGTQSCHFHSRIITATNRDLEQQVEAGRFREDLLHRLNVLPLRIPPLRERPRDIPPLVSYFVRQFSSESRAGVDGVCKETMERLYAYSWPGNVRQLRNVIHRACVLAETRTISDCELPEQRSEPQRLPPEFSTLPLDDIERHVILSRIEQFQGNKTAAAAALGVSSRTLRNKMARYREQGVTRLEETGPAECTSRAA